MTQPKIDHLEAPRPEAVVPAQVGGVACYAFKLQSGWVNDWDKGNVASGNTKPNERAEISYEVAPSSGKGKSPWNVTPQSGKQVYRLQYNWKAGFPSARWNVFTQFHPPDDWGGKHGFGGITGHGTSIDIANPLDDSGSVFIFRTPLITDVWFDWDLAVNWASNADGYVVLKDRVTGKILVRWTGVTLPQGMAYKYLKQGYYRNPTDGEGTVYQPVMDIRAGDLGDTAPVDPLPDPTPVPTPGPERAALQAAVQQFDAIIADATAARDKAKAALGTTS